jgi:hypothetical protein
MTLFKTQNPRIALSLVVDPAENSLTIPRKKDSRR